MATRQISIKSPNLTGGVVRRPQGDEAREMWLEVRMSDERARVLEEESEERIEQDFLAGGEPRRTRMAFLLANLG